jgi:CO/xanthine dehydrogenase Mo-binding subunit
MLKLEELLVTRKWVGQPVPRKEDLRLVKGEGSYVDDLDIDCHHVGIFRSDYAHARIKAIDTTRALALKGVLAVITGKEVARETKPVTARAITKPAKQYIMAVDKVRYMGEPVAAVVAEDPSIAEDALALIDVEYEPLKPVVKIEDAIKEDAPLIFEEAGGNVLLHDKMVHGSIEEAYKDADLVLKEYFKVHRYSSTPLEPWAIIAQYNADKGSYVAWANDQQHGRSIVNICNLLGISNDKFRLIVPDSGGGFGIKLALWPYTAILCLLAKRVDKPVKWIQTRREHLLAGTHAPDVNMEIELAVKKDGRILGLSMKDMENDGSFIHTAGIYGLIFVQPEQMPYTTPSGEVYESGNYPECLRKALSLIGYEEFKKEKDALGKQGKYIGIGISAGIEPGTSNLGYYYTSKGLPEYTGNAEGAVVGIDFDGNVNVLSGSVDSGQGHVTSIAQVVADMLAITPDQVSMQTLMDSLISPFVGHSGTYSNKFNDVDIGAVIMATKKVRDKMLKIASHQLDVEEGKLKLQDGKICSVENEEKAISFKEIANLAYKRVLFLPDGVEPGLKEIAYYKTQMAKRPSRENFNIQITHANSVHAVKVEVDPESGTVRFLRYVIVHDCGNQINPGIVEGMVIGSTVHGIGAALYEDFVYNEDGQLLASTFMDYLKPLSVSVPKFELAHMESPCPYTLLGTKAVGEGGSLPSLAAIANAVENALSPFDVTVTSLPITPEKVMKAITETKRI